MEPKEYLSLNRNINRGYRKLDVWNEAVRLFEFIKGLLNKIPNLSFKVKAQIEDSAFSVSSNIAEGYCRRSLRENIQFINIALASMGENYSQIFNLFNAGIIEEKDFHDFDTIHYKLENMLISFNKSMIEKLKNAGGWNKDYMIREVSEYFISE